MLGIDTTSVNSAWNKLVQLDEMERERERQRAWVEEAKNASVKEVNTTNNTAKQNNVTADFNTTHYTLLEDSSAYATKFACQQRTNVVEQGGARLICLSQSSSTTSSSTPTPHLLDPPKDGRTPL